MASRVNKSFVIIVSSVVVVLLIGVAAIGVLSLRKSSAQLAAIAAQHVAGGNYELACETYARAVNKDQSNPELLEKWIDCLEHFTPTSQQTIRDKYYAEYVPALQTLAEVQRTNVAAHRRFLDEAFSPATKFGGDLAAWEALLRKSEDALRFFADKPEDGAVLRRYAGMARLNVIRASKSPDRVKLERAREDLTAAIAADPADADATIALADLDMVRYENARLGGDEAAAAAALADATGTLETFTSAHPDSTKALVALLRLRVNSSVRALQREGKSTRDVISLHRDTIDRVITSIREAPPASLDPAVVGIAAQYIQAVPELGRDAAVEVLTQALKGHPNDPILLKQLAETEARADRPEEAIAAFQKVVDLPNRPVGLMAVVLQSMRSSAAARQIETVMLQIKGNTPPEEREQLIARAKKFRDDLAAKAGESSKEVRLADVKLKYLANELGAARVAVTAYLDRDDPNDVQALGLLGDILQKMNVGGEARRVYERVVELQPANVQARLYVANMAAQAGEYPVAIMHLQQVMLVDPSNKEIERQLAVIKEMQRYNRGQGTTTDKVLIVLDQAEKASTADSDPQRAIAIIRKGIVDLGRDDRLVSVLIQLLAMSGDRAAALEEAKLAVQASPDNRVFKSMEQQLSFTDPLEAAKASVLASDVSEVQKQLYLASIYQRFGKKSEAAAALAEARRIDPENPGVIEQSFSEALVAGDLDKAAALGAKGTAKNIDNVDGLSYKGRLAWARGEYQEGAAAFQRAAEIDRFNPIVWRFLGDCRFKLKQYEQAAQAYTQAVEIQPNEMASFKGLIMSRVLANRLDDALMIARRAPRGAASDEDFAMLLIGLETEAPSGDRKIAIEKRREWAKNRPADRENRVQLAGLLIGQKALDEARAQIDLLSKDGAGVDVATLDAAWQAAKGNVLQARKVLEDFIATQPAGSLTDVPYVRLAALLAQNNLVEEALSVLQEGAKYQDPVTMNCDRQRARLMMLSNRCDDAVVVLKSIRDRAKSDPNDELTRAIIECLLKTEKYAEAESAINSIESASKDPALLLAQARAAAGRNDMARARTLLDRAVAADPTSPVPYITRADFLSMDAERAQDVEQDLQAAIRVDPKGVAARVRLARFYAYRGQWDQALDQWQQAVAAEPDNDGVRLDLLNTLMGRGNFKQAADLVSQAIARKPDSVQWLVFSSDVFIKAGTPDPAIKHLEHAWDLNKSAPVALAYVEVLLKSSRPNLQKARDVLAAPELEIDKSFPLLMTRARVFKEAGQMPRAEADAMAAFALVDQSDANACANFVVAMQALLPTPTDQARMLAALKTKYTFKDWFEFQDLKLRAALPGGPTPEIVAGFERLAERKDRLDLALTARSSLARLAITATPPRPEEAAAQFRKVLELAPDDPETNNNLAYILCEDLGRPEEALPYAQRGSKARVNSMSYLDTLGTIYLRLGRLAEAEETLQRALAASPNMVEKTPVFLHLGEVQLAQGNRTEASKSVRRLEELLAGNPGLQAEYGSKVDQLRQKLSTP
ncbi:MAG: tetratricopeptide repeat protein [Phycisphaeraceae bacterium]|nr:tetratricopeptide repeat protein [Phycisphaeraceae bacterium]